MLKRLLPRQDGFFELFQKTAEVLVLAATQFYLLLQDLDNPERYVSQISVYEHEGDVFAHTTFQLLHKTFITPFDRHDIHKLTSKLDDILDLINRRAQRFPFYNLKSVPEELIELSELSIQCTKLLKQAVFRLHSLKKADEILKFCEDIDYLESKAHILVLAGEKDLYLDDNDFKTFFKLKDIYASTKSVINSCQDAGNIIKGIVLEYS